MTRGCSVPIWQKRGRRKCKTRRRAAGKRFAEKWHGRTHARQNVRETLGKIFESECIPVMRWRRPYPPSCLSGRHWGWCFRFRPPFSLTTLFFLWSPPVFGSPRFGESTSDSDPVKTKRRANNSACGVVAFQFVGCQFSAAHTFLLLVTRFLDWNIMKNLKEIPLLRHI